MAQDRQTLKNRKDRAAYFTAIIAFLAGWGMTIAGFCVPPMGEVSNSVLAILGEALVYAASVFGVTLYFSSQMAKFKADTRKYLNSRDQSTEDGEDEYGEE